jgi:hypothetical protein
LEEIFRLIFTFCSTTYFSSALPLTPPSTPPPFPLLQNLNFLVFKRKNKTLGGRDVNAKSTDIAYLKMGMHKKCSSPPLCSKAKLGGPIELKLGMDSHRLAAVRSLSLTTSRRVVAE